jgi:hypothetical protein
MEILPTQQMTSAERSALANWQRRINESGEIMPEPTIIQDAEILDVIIAGDVLNKEYHGERYADYLSAGKLKECRTPLHLKRSLEEPEAASMNLNIGSAAHSLILEPDKFEYRLFDDSGIFQELIDAGYKTPRATKQYKEWHAQFENEAGELMPDVLPKETFKSLWQLKKTLRKDQMLTELFNGSKNEWSWFVEYDQYVFHKASQLKVKVRPDGLKIATAEDSRNFAKFGVNRGEVLIISVKTTIDASPDGFTKQAYRLGYDLTEAFYHDVIQSIYKAPVHTIMLTLEKEKEVFTGAYLVRYCSSDFINSGREKYRENLRAYCMSDNLTEGYQFLNGKVVEL